MAENKKTVNKKGRIKAKLLNSYYGHVANEMKLICITGTTGRATVAHFVHQIIGETGERVAILASDSEIRIGMLHKFLSDAWKAGANYVVLTAPAESLMKNTFYGLPIHVAAMTDYVPSGLDDVSAKEYERAEDTLFDMSPKYVILNRDDANFHNFSSFKGTDETLTYGVDNYADVRILNTTLYRKGVEADLDINGVHTNVASFIPGETTISYMAAAAAIASALNISATAIADGIANYNPENVS